MLEAECSQLDIRIEAEQSGECVTPENVNQQLQLRQQLQNVERDMENFYEIMKIQLK